jgi:hypothetical protein
MPPAADPLADRTPSDRAVGDDAFAITPSDTAGDELARVCRFIWVGGSGSLRVLTERGTTVTFAAVPVGLFAGVRVRQVFATGTTATTLVGVP